MQGYARAGLHARHEEEYEQEDYDEYEEEGSEVEEEQKEEVRKPTKEEQDFLKLREKLKKKIREGFKKESVVDFGRTSRSQEKSRTLANDKFGSFFGPSQPVIASRVIEESRSIRETQHITARGPSSVSNSKRPAVNSSVQVKKNGYPQQPKVFNEAKKKAQTLKDLRDYSFLLSDDADLPAPAKEQPVPRTASFRDSDGRSAQALSKSKVSSSKPLRPPIIGHDLKNPCSANRHIQSKMGSGKEHPINRPKLTSAEPKKILGGGGARNGSGRPEAHKSLPTKATVQSASKPSPKVNGVPGLTKKPLSAKPQSMNQNHHMEQRRISQGPDKFKATPKQSLPPSKAQSSRPAQQPAQVRGTQEVRTKKRPVSRNFDDDDDDAIRQIRQMFGYNPSRFHDDEDDDDCMEVGFDTIQAEERRSSKIARKEDEEQLRLIEEEERRERMRKKQKRG